MKLEILEASGTPTQIGFSHGEGLRDKIKDTWEFYRGIIRADTDRIKNLALHYGEHIKLYFPEIYEEISGISSGANIEQWKILALNSRTELIRTINSAPSNECTLVYNAELNILAQTWDWAEALESLISLIKISPSNSELEILTLTEPGIVGKMGINNFGVSVGLTILKAPTKLDGVPIHVLLRKCLECKNRDEVLSLLSSTQLGSTSSVTTIYPDEIALGVEVFGNKFFTYTPETRANFCHTNHYLCLEPNAWEIGPDMESSVSRYKRGLLLLENMNEFNPENLKSIIHDKIGNTPICHNYKPDDVIGSDGTVCRILYYPNKREMEIGMGTDKDYHSYKI